MHLHRGGRGSSHHGVSRLLAGGVGHYSVSRLLTGGVGHYSVARVRARGAGHRGVAQLLTRGVGHYSVARIRARGAGGSSLTRRAHGRIRPTLDLCSCGLRRGSHSLHPAAVLIPHFQPDFTRPHDICGRRLQDQQCGQYQRTYSFHGISCENSFYYQIYAGSRESMRLLPGNGGNYSSARALRRASAISSYSASVRMVRPLFISKVPPHSSPPLYLGTMWKCR